MRFVSLAAFLLFSACNSGLQSSLCGADTQQCCEGSKCKSGLTCGDGVCTVCGSEAQPCCDGTGCGARLVCGASSTCLHCGSAGEVCCPGVDGCSSGLSCGGGGKCELQLGCDGGCTTGNSRCTGSNGIESCQPMAGACPAYVTTLASCPSGQTCELDLAGTTAACAEKCPGACVLNSILCGAVGNKVCKLLPAAACPSWEVAPAGTGGICTRGACTPTGLCWESPTPVGSNLVGVSAWAEDQFFILDQFGNVIRNDAENWTYEVRADPIRRIRAIATCSPGVTMATGDNGVFLRRYNGSWTPENLGDPAAQLRAISCDPLGRAVLAGAGGKIFIRSDTGAWSRPDSGTTIDFNAVSYYSFAGKGRAYGAGGVGILCSPVYTPASVSCQVELDGGLTTRTLRGAASDPKNGSTWVVGDQGVALDNRGPSGWALRSGLPATTMNAVTAGADHPYAVGNAGAFALHTEPLPWMASTVGTEDFRGVAAVLDNSLEVTAVLAAGNRGTLFLNQSKSAPASYWKRLGGAFPATEDLNAVRGLDSSDVWAVGAGGAVYRRLDEAWRKESQSVTTQDLFAVVPVSANEVYAFGNQGAVIAKRNGVWFLEAMGLTTQPLFGAVTDGKTIIAVGAQGVWLEKAVGAPGTAWTKVNHGQTTVALNAVVLQQGASGAVEVNAVGDQCTLLTRKGTTFTAGTLPMCFGALLSAWEGANGELYVAGEDAWVARRANATAPFVREYPANSLENFYAIAASGTQAWVVGNAGQIFHRVSGNWREEEQELTSTVLKGAWLNGNELYVVGSGGLIWHRQ